MERDELCALVGVLSQYTTGTLSLREKRSGHIRRYWKLCFHIAKCQRFQVPANAFVEAVQTGAYNSVTEWVRNLRYGRRGRDYLWVRQFYVFSFRRRRSKR